MLTLEYKPPSFWVCLHIESKEGERNLKLSYFKKIRVKRETIITYCSFNYNMKQKEAKNVLLDIHSDMDPTLKKEVSPELL